MLQHTLPHTWSAAEQVSIWRNGRRVLESRQLRRIIGSQNCRKGRVRGGRKGHIPPFGLVHRSSCIVIHSDHRPTDAAVREHWLVVSQLTDEAALFLLIREILAFLCPWVAAVVHTTPCVALDCSSGRGEQ